MYTVSWVASFLVSTRARPGKNLVLYAWLPAPTTERARSPLCITYTTPISCKEGVKATMTHLLPGVLNTAY